MHQYSALIYDILENGTRRFCRNGETIALFGKELTLDLTKGFPTVNFRPINYKAAFGELATFIQGGEYVEDFQRNGCNYWNAYATMGVGPSGKPGWLGPIYGSQWRNFGGQGIDQLTDLSMGLIRDPTNRRHLLIAYNPADNDKVVLPACHMLAQFYVDENTFLDCQVYMRSVDVVLGLPYDIAVYAVLQTLLARDCLLKPRKLKFIFGDTHIYANHVNALKEVYFMGSNSPARLVVLPSYQDVFAFKPEQVELVNYNPLKPNVKFELSP